MALESSTTETSKSGDTGSQQQELVEIKVNDEFVQLNGLAVFKCKPTFVGAAGGSTNVNIKQLQLHSELWQLVEWFTSDGLTIAPEDWLNQYKHYQQQQQHQALQHQQQQQQYRPYSGE